jgi:uncharacterized membrane protein
VPEPSGKGPRRVAHDASATPDDDPDLKADRPRAERRIAATITVLVAMSLPLLLPAHLSPGVVWLLPILEGVFLVAILVVDPGRIDRRGLQVRWLSIALVAVLALAAAWGAGRLVWDLLHGDPQTKDATKLLVTGSLVWVQTIIAFAFVYWELDGGGPAERYFHPPAYPDLAFPQQMSPEVCPPGWSPVFVDYLYLSVTSAMAFSPTDVMPLARWAKLTMALESIISIVILSLVIANSVNLLD